MECSEERMQAIENRLSWIEEHLNIKNETPRSQAIPVEAPPALPEKPGGRHQLSLPSPFTVWLKRNWIAVSGILLLLLSCSWFVSYAFECGWITGPMRVELCFIIGIITGGYGIGRMNKDLSYAQLFIFLGETISLLSIYAGFLYYNMMPAQYAFISMLAIVITIAVFAIQKRKEALGIVSIIFAFLIPFGLYEDCGNSILFLNYLFIIDCVTLVMFLTHNWSKALHVAFFVTSICFLSPIPSTGSPMWIFFFTLLYALIFFFPSIIIACGKSSRTLACRGAIMLSFSRGIINWIFASFAASPWNVIYFSAEVCIVFYFVRSLIANWEHVHFGHPIAKYSIGVIFYIFIFSGSALAARCIVPESSLVTFFFIEAMVAVAISLFILKAPKAAFWVTFCFLNPVSLMLQQKLLLFHTPFASVEFWNLCLGICASSCAIWMLYKTVAFNSLSWTQRLFVGWLGVVVSLFAMGLISSISHNLIANANIARGLALVAYVGAAEFLIFMGNNRQWKTVRYFGIAIIAIVLARLFFDEIWTMPIVVRTGICAMVGLLLIGTAYFDKKCTVPVVTER